MTKAVSRLKKRVAERAVEYITPGQVVGLGEGSTALFAVRRIGELVRTGQLQNIICIPASINVEREARQLGIPLTTFEAHPTIDITIDGADEVDPQLNLIKGGGGALLREKIVAQATQREIIVIDDSKLSPAVGTLWAVPVEVIPFGWSSQAAYLKELGADVTLREGKNGKPYYTDQANLILDCNFGPIANPIELDAQLNARAGIVEHGLFLSLTSEVIIAGEDGIRHLKQGENT